VGGLQKSELAECHGFLAVASNQSVKSCAFAVLLWPKPRLNLSTGYTQFLFFSCHIHAVQPGQILAQDFLFGLDGQRGVAVFGG
jgi:hypothetical protein